MDDDERPDAIEGGEPEENAVIDGEFGAITTAPAVCEPYAESYCHDRY